jgi:hypothetical protein
LKKGLKNIRRIPLFADGKEEVPEGSAVVVAYTANIYTGENGNKGLSTNIHWVLVLGIPEDDEEDD